MKTVGWLLILFALAAAGAGGCLSADAKSEKDNEYLRRVFVAQREQYTKTRFCPRCDSTHWLPVCSAAGDTARPCPICNPKGSLEVLD